MKELIRITEQNGKKAVSARELHAFLECETRFNDWIKYRIQQYDFIENVDYVTIEGFTEISVKPQGGRPSVEYALTVNMAKELSMVEGNAKGKQARRYFIACENEAQKIPLLASAYEDRIAALESKIKLIKTPKGASDSIGDCFLQIAHNMSKMLNILESKLDAAASAPQLPPPQVVTLPALPQKKVLTIAEAAEMTGMSKSHLYKLCCSRKVPYFKSGGGKRSFFDRDELTAWMLYSRVKTKDESETEAANIVIKKRMGIVS